VAKRKVTIDDDELLRIVGDERKISIGFEYDHSLLHERELALNYAKGQMPDVPALPNRSKAVSTDVADAINTALPDLVDIFIGGDDVATFQALGEQDEEQAKLETEYVSHVIFDKNPGFMAFYTLIKDALESKLGICKFWWSEHEELDENDYTVPPDQFEMVKAIAEQQGAEVDDVETEEDGQVSFTVRTKKQVGCVKIKPVPPEDFSFARDTVYLRDGTYCNMRSRPRAQQLIEDGYDPDLVDRLPEYGMPSQVEVLAQARDTANESVFRPAGSTRQLRTVEVMEHYIRLDRNGDGKTELWRVVTGGNETILLEAEEVDMVPFAAITPYPVTHRFIGQSLADLMIEIQRIKTALLRMLLDSGYFALNQRNEVAMSGANEWTISDLLRNEPGLPVRSKTGEAVRPIQSGALTFDVTGALEYVNTVAEQRTGIVRNAQGLNPDTLHDTADGARQLIAAAQKRIRMMARIFAETGIKDLFLGVHHLVRTHAQEVQAYVGGNWANLNPKQWPKRDQLNIEIGVGSGGHEHDIIAGNQLMGMLEKAVQAQGGPDGALTNSKAIVTAAVRLTETLGFKNGEQYWTDPATYKPPPPQADPKTATDQAKVQNDQQKLQVDAQSSDAAHQLAIQKFQFETQAHQDKTGLESRRLDIEAEKVRQDALDREHARQLKEVETHARIALDARKNDQTYDVGMTGIQERHATAIQTTAMKGHVELAVQASEARDEQMEQDTDGDGQ
jgi:hypothetical protein